MNRHAWIVSDLVNKTKSDIHLAEPSYDLRERASEIVAPTLITWGDKDQIVPTRVGKVAANLIPGAVLTRFRGGHVVFSSDPDGFLEAVTAFLAEASPDGIGSNGGD